MTKALSTTITCLLYFTLVYKVLDDAVDGVGRCVDDIGEYFESMC
jgi:hypothetical protein